MTIKKVPNPYKKTDEDPDEVYMNPTFHETRRAECACLNCGRMDDDPPFSSCRVAKRIYEICLEETMAMGISVCGAREDPDDPKSKLLYKPLEEGRE